MPCYEIDGLRPVVDPTAYVHPTAVLIGDVIVGPGAYIGPCASLRGDFGRIVLRDGCNVQDTCVIHGFPASDTLLEDNAHIGHGAVLHGCVIRADALVGMNAVVMDEAEIGTGAFVAASAFVRAGLKVPARSLAAGVPARVLRELSDQELTWKREGTATYHRLTQRCLATMKEVEPLTAAEPGRRRIEAGKVQPLVAAKRKAASGENASMKLVMDVHIDGEQARAAAVAFDDWAAFEGVKSYALEIAHVEKPAKGELDLRVLPWLLQLIAANGLQPEVIVFDGFVHLDARETPGLGRRLHDALGGRVAVIGVAKSGFKGAETPAQLEVYREEETAPLIVTCAGIDLGAAKARLRAMHGRKRVPTLMKLAARIAKGNAAA